MSLLNNILSAIDGDKTTTATSQTPKKPMPLTSLPKPAPRPAGATNGNGMPPVQAVKRKAEGPPDGGQAKMPRKDGAAQLSRPNSANSMRAIPTPDAAKTKAGTSMASIPYRGTAGLSTARPAALGVKKPGSTATTPTTATKPAFPASKPAATTTAAPTNPVPVKKGSYAAILAAAKAREQTKPVAPPIKHEPTKILTKKERLELRAQALGKKPPVAAAGPAKAGGLKADPKADVKEKRKPADIGYQGTARPKKPVEIGYRGTARPATAVGGAARRPASFAATKAKAKPARERNDGYLDWSDVGEDDVIDEEEDGYESSDMEAGGFFDIDEEEQRALKAAKAEDAKALAEEMEAKRLKEERKRKLMAMNSAAAGKRRY